MRLKSYFSATVEAAMEMARKELGEDALLINARPAAPETRYLGTYEVVFGVNAPESPVIQPESGPAKADRELRDGLAEMRRQIERLTRAFQSPPMPSPPRVREAPAPSPAKQALLAEELDCEIADAVLDGTRLEDLFTTDATLGRPDAARAVVALVGPPGAGKTSTLVKLAARYGLARRRSVHILSSDIYRVAGADQLRALAAILGIGFDLAETPLALRQLVEERKGKSLIFIDTPGFAFQEMEEARELAGIMAAIPDMDTHLVLPASMKTSDLSRVVTSYQWFRPAKLLFTKIDETARYGALVSQSAKQKLPLSFLCSGQQIPDDIEEATPRRVAELVLGGGPLNGAEPLHLRAAA